MASNRKKQDEKHLKILRNLVSLSGNKQCFDCSQRGPTYINTTIGSFVCTKCSGMLRGLTPPHRVKSISMASFTPEEIEALKTKGNDYCRKVWLALYDSNHAQDTKDEQHIQDFMVAKYEKKRYYMEPAPSLKNGNDSGGSDGLSWPIGSHEAQSWPRNGACGGPSEAEPWPKSGSDSKSWPRNGSSPPAPLPPPVRPPPVQASNMAATTNMFTPDRTETFKFPPPTSDPFGPVAVSVPSGGAQPSFANFDDNPIFSSPPVPSLPLSTSFPSALRTPRPLQEDKYAALKDLDSMMKMQIESPPPPPAGLESDEWPESGVTSNPFTALRAGAVSGLGSSPNNPFRSGVDVSGPPAWGAMPTVPTSHSMPFPVSWNTASDLTVGPSKSGNPFL